MQTRTFRAGRVNVVVRTPPAGSTLIPTVYIQEYDDSGPSIVSLPVATTRGGVRALIEALELAEIVL